MNNRSPEINAYIEKSAEFSHPILNKIRELFHKACPQLQETTKWGFPHFEYKGILGSMAAFKKHVSLGFRKGQIMKDPHNLLTEIGKTSMSSIRVETLSDMPEDSILLDYIREAVQLNENDVKATQTSSKPKGKKNKKELVIPGYFMDELKASPEALNTFEHFSYSHQKEYVEWITEAKQEATREKRMATALEWMAEGKSRNWKYMKNKK